jgi:hypothetical protein
MQVKLGKAGRTTRDSHQMQNKAKAQGQRPGRQYDKTGRWFLLKKLERGK